MIEVTITFITSIDTNLDISHFHLLIKTLGNTPFLLTNWIKLGDALGLHPNILSTIENEHPSNPSRCLRECVLLWLKGTGSVEATISALYNVLDDICGNSFAHYFGKLLLSFILHKFMPSL